MGPSRRIREGLAAGAFTCLTDSILRFDCRWSAPEPGQGTGPWLLFTSHQVPGSQHRCVFRAGVCSVKLPPEEVLLPSDSFTLTFHHHVSGEEQVCLVDPQYLPRRHVKLDPPSDLQSNVSSDSCVLTWSLSPALEPMRALLAYELAFRKRGQAWEARHKGHIIGVTWLRLEAAELDPGSTHEARLRVQMAAQDGVAEEERYEGQWSEWSQSACFPSPRRRGPLTPPWGRPGSSLVALSVFLLLTSLTYLLFKLMPRVKRALGQGVPSPAAFFQPLYSVHHGNFQVGAASGSLRAFGVVWWAGADTVSSVQNHKLAFFSTADFSLFGKTQALPQLDLQLFWLEAALSGYMTWAGVHRAGLQLSREGDSPLPGAPESGFGEAISPLTYIIYSPLGGEERGRAQVTASQGAPAWSSEDKLPAGSGEWGAQVPAYLPQEDWAIVSPVRLAPPDPEGGSSSDYCALGCDGKCPFSALAWSLSWERRSPDAQPRARSCTGTGQSAAGSRPGLGPGALTRPPGESMPCPFGENGDDPWLGPGTHNGGSLPTPCTQRLGRGLRQGHPTPVL